MKTTVIGSNGTTGDNNGLVSNKAAGVAGAGASAVGKGSAIVPNKNFDKPADAGKVADGKEVAAGKVEAGKVEVKADASAVKVEAGQVVEPRADFKEAAPAKPVRNLDSTIKLALDLSRRINQRGKLLETIGTLEAFEVAQQDDAEETDVNIYQGCTLTIEDDNGREFSTKNPFIIKAVAADVNRLCVDKLAEIESEIFIPA